MRKFGENGNQLCGKWVNKLVWKQLVEANTRSLETISGASHVRVTSAGMHYVRSLAKTFAYLDLVLQDTPINDEEVEKVLRESVFHVDNLVDREAEKLERVRARFRRVEVFLAYLKKEEDAERSQYGLQDVIGPLGKAIVPIIEWSYVGERNWIERRLVENREKYQEEMFFDRSEEEEHKDSDQPEQTEEELQP
jgi:hypothetical protein